MASKKSANPCNKPWYRDNIPYPAVWIWPGHGDISRLSGRWEISCTRYGDSGCQEWTAEGVHPRGSSRRYSAPMTGGKKRFKRLRDAKAWAREQGCLAYRRNRTRTT
jgi:hypothetical protein